MEFLLTIVTNRILAEHLEWVKVMPLSCTRALVKYSSSKRSWWFVEWNTIQQAMA